MSMQEQNKTPPKAPDQSKIDKQKDTANRAAGAKANNRSRVNEDEESDSARAGDVKGRDKSTSNKSWSRGTE